MYYLKKYLPYILGLVLFASVPIANAFPVYQPVQGGTGTNSIPNQGDVLVGQGNGIYSPEATSTLGITSYWSTTNGLDIFNNNSGGIGVGQTSPQAEIHITPFPQASSFTATLGAVGVTTGYPFGSGDKTYYLYSEDDTKPMFAPGLLTNFVEPSSSVYDPSGGVAVIDEASGGYIASGYNFNYTIWALYNGNTVISDGSITTSDTGTDNNNGQPYGVDVSFSNPSVGSPSGYLVLCNGSNPNSGLYMIVNNASFTDNNAGWGSAPSTSPLLYNVNLNWNGAVSPVNNYVLNNATIGTYLQVGNTTSATDDTTWSSTAITTTPTGQVKTAIFDGSLEDHNGISYSTPSINSPGFLHNDGGTPADLNFQTLTPSDIPLLNLTNISAVNHQLVYGSSGTLVQSPNGYFDGSSFRLNSDFGLSRTADIASSGTLNNYATVGVSNLIFSGPVNITGFSGGYDGKILFLWSNSGVTLKNLDAGSSATNRILTPNGGNYTLSSGNGPAILLYDNTNDRWNLMTNGNPDNTVTANTWTQNQTYSNAVNLAFATTTGTKIGTSTTQKIGFWNATPIVQPSNQTTIDNLLRNTGLWASGATTSPFTFGLLVASTTATSTFNDPVLIKNTLIDASSSVGTLGQILESLGNGVKWIASTASQWINQGSNIYFNAGNVGIGTTTASYLVDTYTSSTGTTNGWRLQGSSFVNNVVIFNQFSDTGGIDVNNGGGGGSGGDEFLGYGDSFIHPRSGGLAVGSSTTNGLADLYVWKNTGSNAAAMFMNGNVAIGTTTPDSLLDVNGSERLEGASSFVTATIGGAIISGGCDSVTTSGLDSTMSSTTAFITTPQADPGTTLGGTWAYSYLSGSGAVTTRVCANVSVTPNSVKYTIKILK